MGIKVVNNAYGVLAAPLAVSDGLLTLEQGQGNRFPTLGVGDYFYGTVFSANNDIEIVKVTARNDDTMTILRGQDDTQSYAFGVGDEFELRPTAALFNECLEEPPQASVSLSGITSYATITETKSGLSEEKAVTPKGLQSVLPTFSNSVPTGSIFIFPTQVAPHGYFPCDGRKLDRNNHPDLWRVLRHTYGGTGAKFKLPDFRGEFLRGWDNGRGVDQGRILGSSQDAEIQSHKHAITLNHSTVSGHGAFGFPSLNDKRPNVVHKVSYPDGSRPGSDGRGNPLYSFGGDETRPRNIAINYIIKI